MGEAQSLAFEREHTGLDCLRYPTDLPGCAFHECRRRLHRCCGEQRGELSLVREGVEPAPQQGAAVRDRQRLAVLEGTPVHQRTADLERVERVAAAGSVELGQPWTGEAQPELLTQNAAEVVQRQRPHPDLGDGRGGRTVESQRERQLAVRAPRDEHAYGRVEDAPEGELEHLLARRVQPLDVVDRDEHGASRRGESQQRHDSPREREPIGGLSRPRALKRLIEDIALRLRQRGALPVQQRLEQVAESRERERRLGLCGSGDERVPALLCLVEPVQPECRLADAGFTLDHGAGRPVGVEQPLQARELLIPTDDQVGPPHASTFLRIEPKRKSRDKTGSPWTAALRVRREAARYVNGSSA